jgi:spermidine synthase
MRNTRTAPRHAIDISEEDGIRYLHFGSDWVQGAMRIARPWSLELAYTREMMAGLLLRDLRKWPRSALLIGLGAGSLAKFIYRNFPDCRITIVEINPQVEFIARQYFKLPDDPQRLAVQIECGADYLQAGSRQFDMILSDGFDASGRPGMLDTPAFYQSCQARLSDDGLFCVNLLREKASFRALTA